MADPTPAAPVQGLDLVVLPFDRQKKNFWTFIRSLCMLFLANQAKYQDDEAKVLFALSKMTGEGFAAEWANIHREDITDMEVFPTWNTFLADMKQVFDDPNDRATALNKLE